MDDKEFRKLRREDLIEIIYQYQRREQRLTQENEMLRAQLEDRRIRMEKTGSIAEAALALSGIFAAAQKAADLYLQSVKEHAENPVVPQQEAKPQQKPGEEPRNEKSQEIKKDSQKAPAAAKEDKPNGPKAVPQPGKPAELRPSQAAAKPAPEAKTVPILKMNGEQKSVPASNPTLKTAPVQVPGAAAPGKAPEAVKPEMQKTPAAPKAPVNPTAAAVDTDEFISSLKDMLGM